MQIKNRILLNHKLGRVLNKIQVNRKPPHHQFSALIVQRINFHSKRCVLLNEIMLVLLLHIPTKLILLCHHVIVIQLDALELILDSEVLGFSGDLE